MADDEKTVKNDGSKDCATAEREQKNARAELEYQKAQEIHDNAVGAAARAFAEAEVKVDQQESAATTALEAATSAQSAAVEAAKSAQTAAVKAAESAQTAAVAQADQAFKLADAERKLQEAAAKAARKTAECTRNDAVATAGVDLAKARAERDKTVKD